MLIWLPGYKKFIGKMQVGIEVVMFFIVSFFVELNFGWIFFDTLEFKAGGVCVSELVLFTKKLFKCMYIVKIII